MISDEWLKKRPIAHRGMWGEGIPENSLAAFETAVIHDCPIELDVQMLADGTLVVFHDWTLDRMTHTQGELRKKSVYDLADIRLVETNEGIPQLQKALEIIGGKVPVLIEMKNRGHKRSAYIEKLSDVLKDYPGVFALSSFDPLLVTCAQKNFDRTLCGQNFSAYKDKGKMIGWAQKNFMYLLWYMSGNAPAFIVCTPSLLSGSIVSHIIQKRKIPLLVWDVKTQQEYEHIKEFVDNYFFDIRPYD